MLVLDAATGPPTKDSRDVVRRVGDRPVGALPDALVEDVTDRVQLDPVGVVGGEVTGSAVLARVQRGDLPIESFGLAREVGEVVTSGHEGEVVETTLSPRWFAGFDRSDRAPLLLHTGLDLSPRRDQRTEIGRSVGRSFVEERPHAVALVDQVAGAAPSLMTSSTA
jgi:hypothetical protein